MKRKKHRRKKGHKVHTQMTPKPKTTVEEMQKPETVEEAVSEPEVAEEAVSEPETVEEAMPEPEVTEEAVSEPEVAEETVSEPEIMEEAVSEPEVVEEAVSEPEAVKECQPEVDVASEDLPEQEQDKQASIDGRQETQPLQEDLDVKPAENTDTVKDKKRSKKRWLWGVIPISAAIVLIAVYFGFYLYFSDRFFWGTRINGFDCGCMTLQSAEEKLQQTAREYQLTIYGRDGKTETIKGQEIGMFYQIRNELQAIQDSQNAFLWFTGFFQHWDYAVNGALIYDQEILAELVETLSVLDQDTMKEPTSARISEYLPEIKGYQIIEEEEGSLLFAQEASAQIMNAVFYMQDQLDLDGSGLYLQPRTRSDNQKLNRLVEALNHYTQTEVIYTFGDEQLILDGDTIHDWISVRGSFVYLDRAAVRSYVEELARERNTYYDEKEFVTTSGEVKHLRSGYGWLIDVDAETEALLADLENGGQSVREPIYKRRAADYSENGIADSYVEIDLGNQHLYLYLDGELILETDFVSGSMVSGNATPAGIYDLDYKERNTVLRGPTWESYVNYWMPFNGSVGMHDATWRNQFGGDIYINGGSHGCINLPYTAAREIYQYVYSGFPVVCYY